MATITVYTISDVDKKAFKLRCLQQDTTMTKVLAEAIRNYCTIANVSDTEVGVFYDEEDG